jgi:membrane fusion protein, multidrug efflux system
VPDALSLNRYFGELDRMSGRVGAGLSAVFLLVSLAGCKPENKFIAPPPPEISVAVPLKQSIVPFTQQTGNTQAFNSVDLVARVEGFLIKIGYEDGAVVKKGDLLFQIDPTTYIAQVKQSEAQLAATQAQLVNAQAEFTRQETLLRQAVTAQNTYDVAKAKRDALVADIDANKAALAVAQANLGYTNVVAPYDGIVTRHLVSVGELVGASGATKLATVIQLDPIYVYFNLSEQEVLKIRSGLKEQLTLESLARIPLDIGLMNEEGYPHKGHLNYVSPGVDPSTGTIEVRGLFENPKRDLLPGFFLRVRVPESAGAENILVVPNRAVSDDQAGKYVLVVNKDDIVEEKRVKTGQLLVGDFRVVESGLAAADRVVLTTSGRAVPGSKVVPKLTTLQAPPSQ